MSDSAVTTTIRKFIEDTFLYTRGSVELNGSTDLLGNGIIDSMGVVDIVTFLEGELGVTVKDDEITEENLGTLDAIAEFVARKRSGQADG